MYNFRELFQQSDMNGARSTILKSLIWFVATVLASVTACVKFGAPTWLMIGLFSFFGLAALVFLWTFIYCVKKNPDALRSEKFSIQKMAIEKGLIGDNTTGLIQDAKEIKTIEQKGKSEDSKE